MAHHGNLQTMHLHGKELEMVDEIRELITDSHAASKTLMESMQNNIVQALSDRISALEEALLSGGVPGAIVETRKLAVIPSPPTRTAADPDLAQAPACPNSSSSAACASPDTADAPAAEKPAGGARRTASQRWAKCRTAVHVASACKSALTGVSIALSQHPITD